MNLSNKIGRLKLSRRWLIVPPVLVGLLAVALLSRSRRELARIPITEEAVAVPVLRVTRQPVAPSAIGYGTARPARIWSAVAEVRGKVTAIHPQLRSGNDVKSGDVLVEIDELDYKLRVVQRESDLAGAKAVVKELQASEAADESSLQTEEQLLTVTEKELERLKLLRSSSAASQSETERAEQAWLRQVQSVQQLRKSLAVLPAQIESAQASVKLAQARLDESRRDLARTQITAPFGGVLSGVSIEAGQVINLTSPLFELHDIETIEIDAQFSPSQILPLMRGEEVGTPTVAYASLRAAIDDGRLIATVTAHSGKAQVRWPGKPIRVTESIDPATRTVGIVIAVDNTARGAEPMFAGRELANARRQTDASGNPVSGSDIRLYPGVYCEVTLAAAKAFDSIVIPNTALDRGAIFVVTPEQRIKRRPVTVAYAAGQQLVIAAGIEEGELVVVKPPMPAIEDMLIIPEDGGGVIASGPAADRRQ